MDAPLAPGMSSKFTGEDGFRIDFTPDIAEKCHNEMPIDDRASYRDELTFRRRLFIEPWSIKRELESNSKRRRAMKKRDACKSQLFRK
jgi:hypothetical protein